MRWVGVSDSEDDGGAFELHTQGGKAASSEPLGIEADERTGELRGHQRAEHADRRDSRQVLQRASRQEGEPEAGVYRYVRRRESVIPLRSVCYKQPTIQLLELLIDEGEDGLLVGVVSIGKLAAHQLICMKRVEKPLPL